MTKQMVELVYHDAETEKPERDPVQVNQKSSVNVLGFSNGGWEVVYYAFDVNRWRSARSLFIIHVTIWTDLPPIPKKKVWVKKEAHCVGHLGNIHGSEIDNVTFRVPGIARNIVCTYEIEEEQP